MCTNKKNIKLNLPLIFILVVMISILTYIYVDYFIYRPKYEHKVDILLIEVDHLNTILDNKLPEMDSVITDHRYKIVKQNIEIQEMFNMTNILMK